MSARCDKEYAEKYEEDVKWYKWFTTAPTDYQLQTIQQIEKRYLTIKFTGTTRKEASEFIDNYGSVRYNRASRKRWKGV